MLSEVKSNLKFLEIQNRQGKNGNAFQLVVLADPVNYEKFDFFKRDDLNIDGISNGDTVNAVLEISRRGYNTNVDLHSITKVSAK